MPVNMTKLQEAAAKIKLESIGDVAEEQISWDEELNDIPVAKKTAPKVKPTKSLDKDFIIEEIPTPKKFKPTPVVEMSDDEFYDTINEIPPTSVKVPPMADMSDEELLKEVDTSKPKVFNVEEMFKKSAAGELRSGFQDLKIGYYPNCTIMKTELKLDDETGEMKAFIITFKTGDDKISTIYESLTTNGNDKLLFIVERNVNEITALFSKAKVNLGNDPWKYLMTGTKFLAGQTIIVEVSEYVNKKTNEKGINKKIIL